MVTLMYSVLYLKGLSLEPCLEYSTYSVLSADTYIEDDLVAN